MVLVDQSGSGSIVLDFGLRVSGARLMIPGCGFRFSDLWSDVWFGRCMVWGYDSGAHGPRDETHPQLEIKPQTLNPKPLGHEDKSDRFCKT